MFFAETKYGIKEPISSNDFNMCLDCGVKISDNNDSGWEYFKDDGVTTQSCCIKCDGERESEPFIKNLNQ